MLLKFLDVDYYVGGLKPVTSTVTLTRDEKFHENGLFSEEIFGRERSPERRTSYSYINLNTYVIHPTALGMLYRLDRRLKKFLSAEALFSLDESGNLIEDENGVTGISEFMKMFPKIKFNPSDVSKRFVDVLKTSYDKNVLFINKIPVIPPSFRDVTRDPKSGEYKLDPLNDYYLTILKRSFSIKSSGPPGPLLDILTYGMQEAVLNLDEFVKGKLSHKFGLIRSQLLGKRVEFSARAVIANGPLLKINEIGIPFRMAITLFEPFIIHILLYTDKFDRKSLEDAVRKFTRQELSIESIKNVIKFISTKDVIPSDIEKIFHDATEEVMKGRLVLAKRDPVLIPESVRSFRPILIDGNVIRINNMQVAGFNADFDGDQMAVFHPLSDKAQEDAKKLLRVATGENSTSISFGLNKESFLGLFLLTKEYHSKATPKEITDKDLDSIKDPAIPVLYKKRITTAGKVIFNNCLPEGFRFVDVLVGKKVANSLISEILNKYGEDTAKECTFKLQTVAYKFATLIGSSLTLDVFDVPQSILKLKEDLDKVGPEEGAELIQKMRKMMIEHLKDTGLYDLCESGSTKGWDQPTQILITKGIISDVEGNILKPIKGSFGEGLTPSEHFKASLGARKGIVDRVINTADTGYTSRQLAYLLNSVELDLLLKDCKTKRTISLRLTDDIIKRLTGRFIIENGKVVEFIPSKFKSGDTIQLRSPIYCTNPKICHTCYGKLLERHKTPYVGVLASQIIGERGTQLILKSFHSGGAIKVKVRDVLQEFCENDPHLIRSDINKIFKQNKDKIIVEKEGILTLDLKEYDLGNDLVVDEEDGKIYLKSLLGLYETTDGKYNISIILDAPVVVKIQEEYIHEKKERIILSFNKDDEIFEIPIEKEELKELVLYTRRLIGGGVIFRDTEHLLMKLIRVYGGDISNMDLVHLEILVSQCLRDKERPIIPARLGRHPEDPSMFNLKKNVFTTSFLQGLSFENIGEAIRAGLTSEYELEPSVLEKVLLGTLIEEEKRKR